MNCSVCAFLLIIFFVISSNLCLASARTSRQRDTNLQNKENEGRLKQDEEDKGTREANLYSDGDENLDSRNEKSIDIKQRTEDVDELLSELSNTPGTEERSGSAERSKSPVADEEVNLIHGQQSKHPQPQDSKTHSSRGNRKRHKRKFKEIEELHNEMRHVVADLAEISEKEDELEHEVDELRQLRRSSKIQGKQPKLKDTDHRLEIIFPSAKNDKHYISHSHVSDEDREFGSMETEIKDLKDQDDGSDSILHETKDTEKDFGEVVGKNHELRRKNQELCRLLHLSVIRQKDLEATQENDDFYEKLDKLSSETGETLEDQFWGVCGRSYSDRKYGYRKKSKLHSSEDWETSDETESEDTHNEEGSYGGEATKINRKAKKKRQSSQTIRAYEDKKEGRRKSYDRNNKRRKSERKLHKIKASVEGERNSNHEQENILINDKIDEISSSTNRDVHDEDQSGKNESSYSWASENLEKEGEASFPFVDDEKYLEEEANMTISTDDEDKQKVYDHIASVDEETFCGKPRPVVIYPSDNYPVPNKYYTPQGTILHRCSKHSGCCPNEQLTCVPAKKEKVVLNFFAAVLDGSSTIVPHIERLHFVNHTKCGCVFKHHAHLYL